MITACCVKQVKNGSWPPQGWHQQTCLITPTLRYQPAHNVPQTKSPWMKDSDRPKGWGLSMLNVDRIGKHECCNSRGCGTWKHWRDMIYVKGKYFCCVSCYNNGGKSHADNKIETQVAHLD